MALFAAQKAKNLVSKTVTQQIPHGWWTML